MAVIFSMFAGTAWGHPTGWVYFADSYLWSQDANVWAWMDPSGTQWIYDLNTQQWTTLGSAGANGIRTPTTTEGWTYFLWPYVYKQNADNSWTTYYFDESSGSMLWLYNFGTAGWELMNSPQPLVCCLPPARDILGTWTGSGSYIDYTWDFVNNNLMQNALVNASFTFVFSDAGDGNIQFFATVDSLSYQQIAPYPYFFPPVIWATPIINITISSSRWWCHFDELWETWTFNFTTDLMAGSITRDSSAPNWIVGPLGIDSTGLNGIRLTKQSN